MFGKGLKGHGHDVRVRIFTPIINLDCSGVVFKINVLPRTRTVDHAECDTLLSFAL